MVKGRHWKRERERERIKRKDVCLNLTQRTKKGVGKRGTNRKKRREEGKRGEKGAAAAVVILPRGQRCCNA